MKKIRNLCIGALCLGMVFSTTACGNNKNDGDPNVLTMWAGEQWVGTDYDNLDKFIDEFNETNDMGITIELSCKPEFNTALQTAITRGKAPDLITWSRFNTPTFARQNYLYPLDDLIERDELDTSIFQTQTMQECVWGDTTYALPLDVDVWGIYMNMDMFNDYNTAHPDAPAPEPTTWDTLLDAAKKLTQKNDRGQITVSGYTNTEMFGHYFPYLVSAGGDCVSSDGKSMNFDTPENRATLEFIKEVANADICAAGRDTKQAFANEMAAIINQPIYFSNYLDNNYPDINYKFYPLPKSNRTTNGVNGGMLGGFGIATPNPGRYKNEAWEARHEKAWEVMKWWLTEEENMLRWSEISSTLPALTSIYDEEQITSSPVLQTAIDCVDDYRIRPQVPGWYFMQISVFNREIPNYFKGDLSLDELLVQLKTQCDPLIEQNS